MISIVYPIYNPKVSVVEAHINNWRSYPDELRKKLDIVVVDDGSSNPVDFHFDYDINFTLARIEEDIYWNISGAQNLGHKLAVGKWIISTDIDHLFSAHDCARAYLLTKDKGTVYFFKRQLSNGEKYHVHKNTFMMHHDDYSLIGGYDEDMAGLSGWNDSLMAEKFDAWKLDRFVAPINVVMYPEFTSFGPEGKKGRKENSIKYEKKKSQLRNGNYKIGESLRFKWKIIKHLSIS